MNLLTKHRLTDIENKLMVTKGERRGRNKLGVWDQQIHTTMYKTDKTTRSYCIAQGTIFNTLITYNGKESEKEYIYICVDIDIYNI